MASIHSERLRKQVSLPGRPFFYTIEQISVLFEVGQTYLIDNMMYFDRRTPGIHKKDYLKAINLAPLDQEPVWRVSESELIRWMKVKGIQYHERGWLTR